MIGRPKPQILESRTDKLWRSTEILLAQGIFVLTYQGRAVGVRVRNGLIDGPNKYKRTCFINGGHCYALARRLNKLFCCQDFGVTWCPSGIPLSETEYISKFGVDPYTYLDRGDDPED